MKNCLMLTASNLGAAVALAWGLGAFPDAAPAVRAVAELGAIVAGVAGVVGALAALAGLAVNLITR